MFKLRTSWKSEREVMPREATTAFIRPQGSGQALAPSFGYRFGSALAHRNRTSCPQRQSSDARTSADGVTLEAKSALAWVLFSAAWWGILSDQATLLGASRRSTALCRALFERFN